MSDAQGFVQSVVNECRERGLDASANALEAAMPDTDPTNFGGQGAEKVAEAIATTVYHQVYQEVVEVLNQPASEELQEFMKSVSI